ncbi:GIY-YIG nuclease family protein [Citricoccus muralis]|uniref:GIY-YIG nuclease family protein n=1 Tax=Citricoccus muralis TaxID=169134 RepID=A0ABY8HAJ0_9MICC|nr:GIY-YIG nuclease family protein [Citricoccus muralis]WFP17637.1 GIY-YIG nuclease family protein [Citricoccus muralis]
MASSGRARVDEVKSKPKSKELPAAIVQEFRSLFDKAKSQKDNEGRKITSAKWGVYAFYDYDGEPIYVGQTKESLATRLNRHLTNQRTDAVAMRILDVFEVAEMEVWPLWHLEYTPSKNVDATSFSDATRQLDAYEYSAYLRAISNSKFGAILNEKIPPASTPIDLPESYRFKLISEATKEERGHPDVRIARRAETISRLASVAFERGQVSAGLRRVLVVQAVRLAYKSAERYKFAEGKDAPDPSAISVEGLIGSVKYPTDDEGSGD